MIHLMWNFVPGQQPVETVSKSQTSKDTHPSLKKEFALFLIVFEESIFQ